MEGNNCNRGAQSRLPLVGPGDQNLIRKETLAAGRFAPGLQAHSSMRKCSSQSSSPSSPCRYNEKRKAIWTGVRGGLQNRSAAVEVAGVFESHCLPPSQPELSHFPAICTLPHVALPWLLNSWLFCPPVSIIVRTVALCFGGMAPTSHWERLRYPSRRSTSRHHARSQPSLAAPGRRRRCLEVGVSMENAGQSTHPREFEDALMYLPRKAPTSFRKRQIVFDEHHPQGAVYF